ncbi:TraB/GumN family protein [Haloferula rosea]|uniref:TraB/GumN family protein n=1 Tax=Haloferula rosea TaxID=490093 RepID=A0A934RE53_9BACT|nr:TraB/GumN family protein [Haloferula rosea]MBK1826911.1 TraB/GumN family protein [Haloferula rosea]
MRRRLSNWLAGGLAACTLGFASGQEPAAEAAEHPAKPLLWKVEGKGLEKPSWLFGTIHLGKGPLGKLHPAAAKALDGSDSVYTEVSMDPASQLGLAKHFVRNDGKRLSDSIGEELSGQLEAELKAINPDLDAKPFQAFKTWAVGVMIPMLKIQMSGDAPLDKVVWDRASKAGKTMGALETPMDQFGIFDGLEEEEQIVLLAEGLRMQEESRAGGDDPIDKLVKAYLSGDEKKVEAEMERNFTEMAKGEHKALAERLLKQLLDDRNVSMTDGIVERLKAEPAKAHFFAVGAGHYVGKDSIGNLLTKKGYKVTRITE